MPQLQEYERQFLLERYKADRAPELEVEKFSAQFEIAFIQSSVLLNGAFAFIAESFFQTAVEGGEELKTYSYRLSDYDRDPDEYKDGGWVGLRQFFGMYVVSHDQYGEGMDNYGPFASEGDARKVFDWVVGFCIPDTVRSELEDHEPS